MTGWDLIDKFYTSGGLLWTLLIALVIFVFWLIAHPSVVKEWNAQITLWVAAIVPRKRKKAFEKKINLTIDSTKRRVKESMPSFMPQFLPYDLKIKWVDATDTLEAVTRDKQIVVYVPSYKDELKQVVGVLHSYTKEGFAIKAKTYLPEKTRKASDVIITQKLAQYAGNAVYNYFNREYLPELLKHDKSFLTTLDQLKQVDRDGLFIPVLFNEIDKYANTIYPAEPSAYIYDIIIHLLNFVYKIATRNPQEFVPLTFCEGEIRIKIVLAVGTFTSLDKPVKDIEKAIKGKTVNTIYVLATGSKITDAKAITKRVFEQNNQDLYEPKQTYYKRYSRRVSGIDSVCFELNLR